MKPPSQTNAIDFDSAKLQRLGFGQQPPLLERPVSLAQLRQRLGLAPGNVYDAQVAQAVAQAFALGRVTAA